MKWSAALRECVRVQVVRPNEAVHFTPFGRAELLTGADPIFDDRPAAYRAYWVRLPLCALRYCLVSDRVRLHQALATWHGAHGFRLLWIPIGS